MRLDWKTVGGLLLLFAVMRRRNGVAWGEGWHFPVPDLDSRSPTGRPVTFAAVVSSGFRGSRPDHHGVDIMYTSRPEDRPTDVTDEPITGSTRNISQSGRFWAPPDTPILAARDGRIWSVSRTAHGIGIVVDHGKPWATFYQHLETTRFAPHAAGREVGTGRVTTVQAGDELGTMGASSLDGERLRHLHFEAWFKGAGAQAAQDPAPVFPSWGRSSWSWP